MKSILSFLAQLKSKKIAVSLDETAENLRIRGDLKSLTEEEKNEIRANKAEIILFLKERLTRLQSIEPVKLQSNYPISDAQRRLWVLSQFSDGSVAYNMPQNTPLNEDVDIEIFERAIEATIDRHEILRTVFKVDENGEIRQWIFNREELGYRIDIQDYRGKENKSTLVESYISRDSNTPFDLEKGPLLRTALLQVDDNEYVFYSNMHHIISDGWSMKVLYEDVMAFYLGYKQGNENILPQLNIQYKDYASWKNKELEEGAFTEHRNYWLDKLSGKLGHIDFPGANKRPAVKTHNGCTVSTWLNNEFTSELKAYSTAGGGTLFMGIISVLKALVYRYTGQQDLIFGTPTAGRNLQELENQIGFYVNALTLRTKITDGDNFEDLYRKVRQTILEADTHQMYPFDRLVEELNQSRQTSRSAIFDVLVVLQNTGEKVNDTNISNEELDQIIEVRKGTCIYDIKFEFQEVGDYLRLIIEYNSDLYTSEFITNLIDDFKQFSHRLLSSPGESINSVDIALNLDNKQGLNESKGETITSLFQKQVENAKDRTAILANTDSLTYGELDRESNRIARFLQEDIKVQSEEKVAILAGISSEVIASRLGVLKAGGVYVVLNVEENNEELLKQISELEIRSLILSKEYLEKGNKLLWESQHLKHYLCLDADDVLTEKEADENVMMSQDLWDHVGRRADDDITSGGWLSSYTGEPISRKEMDEYSMNAFRKLKPLLKPDMRVLEIGCSSGITLRKIAPEVAFYLGTDLSPVILSGTQQMVDEQGLNNVRLEQMIAHEVSELDEDNFDLIIINSVIQNFHGHNYLLDVIRKGIEKLSTQGMIFIGDVMDLNKKADMIRELHEFKKANLDKNYTTKTDFGTDLFVARGYFEDLQFSEKAITAVEVTEKIKTIENELTKFRYDVLFKVDQSSEIEPSGKKQKLQFGRVAIATKVDNNLEVNISPENTAFLITPKPGDKSKLIEVKHGDLKGWFNTENEFLNFDSTHKWGIGAHASGSDFEIYGSLLFGSQLTILPDDVEEKLEALPGYLNEEKITIYKTGATILEEVRKITREEGTFNCNFIVDNIHQPVTENGFKACSINELVTSNYPKFDLVISDEEKQQVLIEFNDTQVDYGAGKTVVDLFEEVAMDNTNVAIAFEDRSLSFKELDEKSNQLANYLIDRYDIQSEDLVTVMLERSEWMMIAILGVLKSGGAYVPIAPNYPEERIEYIKRDTVSKVCIDSKELEQFRLNESSYTEVRPDLGQNRSDKLAYGIYTSGSTGKPKGVLLEHKSLMNRLLWMKKDLSIEPSDTFIQKTPFTFDVSVWELFLPLITGGKLVFASPNGHKDPNYLGSLMEKHGVSIVHFVPSMLRDAIETIDWTGLKKLRHVVCSGEALPKALEVAFASKASSVSLHNYYGPTEAAIDVTQINLTQYPTQQDEVCIGKPVSNTSVYVVNENLNLVPIGEIGELLIGGVQVARGYLNRPELTKEKFITSPFNKGERLYKTGDLVKWLPDGNIVFVGRKDNQVKIRGHRIELGEIEHRLTEHPEIETAVVITKENKLGEREMLAYIKANKEQNTTDIQSYLKEVLPEFMVPAYYVQVNEFPLTVHGKIDKKSLPNPEGLELAVGSEYVAPRNQMEEKLVAIWQRILEREKVGVLDDFFALGGHSIKAVRLANEYRKEVSVNLSLEVLFAHKTIEKQSQFILASQKEELVHIPALTQTGISDSDKESGSGQGYPISDAQRRLWVLSQFDEGSVAYNMPLTVALNGAYDKKLFTKAIMATIERHEILRTVFKTNQAGEARQWVRPIGELNFELDYLDYRNEVNKEKAVEDYISEDSFKPFDLKNGPLFRASLLQLENEEYVFYYNMHHIISDGWSLGILSNDVLTFYQAFVKGEVPLLKPLRIQYKDYAVWQLNEAGKVTANEHKTFWLNRLKGDLPRINLPAEKQRPRLKTNNGIALRAYFNKETTAKLKNFLELNNGTMYNGLLATWNVLMYRYTGSTDIIIGSSIAGREHPDLENQIGFYSNTLALRNEIDPGRSFNAFFNTVKENTLEAFKHQDYPFIRVVEELGGKHDTGRNAVFDVMLFLQNNGVKVEDHSVGDEVVNEIIDMGYCPSKFDLNIGIQELGDYISFQIVFNPDIYEKEMIENLFIHYRQLVNNLTENPEKELGLVEYMTGTEKTALLGSLRPETDRTILELFNEQVIRTPDDPAIMFGEKQLTYLELDRLASRLANHLIENNQIEPDDLIGVMLNRSEWILVTMLGILKAGGAYVPVDPEDGVTRKEFILNDANLALLITELSFIHDIDYYDGEVFAIDIEFEPDENSADEPEVIVKSNNTAYVIYTSGTTGQPKGVMVSHKSLADYTMGILTKTNIEDCKTFGLVSTIAADLGYTVIYPALCSGGLVRVIAKEDILNAGRLRAMDLDGVKMTPSHWKALQGDQSGYVPNKSLILGGEPFSGDILALMNQNNISCKVFNHYGPTETTIGKLVKEIDVTNSEEVITLGTPIGNNVVYVLDANHQLCPHNVLGEICISGDGLAKGYLGQEDLTNEKFIDNPFIEGQKLYRTGDLGKRLENGEITFVSRMDDQVKVRGYRIELGEVENALLQQDEIIDVAVKIWENSNGENELTAYFVSNVEQNTNSLRSGLRKLLPEYMLPASYVELEKLPLTSNGKIDREALPNPEGIAVLSGIEYVAPRNDIEEKIVEIISYISGRPKNQISIYDNFFDLGLSSLSLMKLYNSINKELNVNLQVVSVFEFSTVNTLSAFLANERREDVPDDLYEDDISEDMDEIIDLL